MELLYHLGHELWTSNREESMSFFGFCEWVERWCYQIMVLGVLTCGLAASSLWAFQTQGGNPPPAGAGEGCATDNCVSGTDACYTTCSPLPNPLGKYYRYLPRYVEKCINENTPPCYWVTCKYRQYDDSGCTVIWQTDDVDKKGCRIPQPD